MWSTPKTGERRSVPFPASLAEELAALMVGKGRDDLVFTNRRGGVLRGSQLPAAGASRCRRWPTAARAARRHVPDDHSARPAAHRGQPGGVSAGANVKAVQRMLGHAKASMTLDVYADLFDDDLDVVADRLDAAIIKTSTTG